MTQTAPLLTPQHAQQLASSAIAETVAAERGYCSIEPGAVKAVQDLAGAAFSTSILRTVLHQGALAFPVYQLGNPKPYTWVLRPDLPRTSAEGKPIKYEWPARTPNVFDLLPCYADALQDPTIPIWITEGAKKADALASAYGARIAPININGVYGWRGRNAHGAPVASADMEIIAWENRTVVIAPDGDVKFNPNVRRAVERLTKLLIARHHVAEVLVLHLPMGANDPKLGVDDYLGLGHTTAELEQHLTSLAAVAATASVPIGVHPDTGAKLFLPPRYDVQHQTLMRLEPNGMSRPIYSGAILVKEIGVDLHTREQRTTVMWNGRGDLHGELTIPSAALTDAKTFGTMLGTVGAAIHPENRSSVATFLVEFAQQNIDAIPRRAHVDRLGLVGQGMVLPAGAVGFSEAVRYVGQPTITVGADADAYPAAIRTAFTWSDAWAFWLILGLSLASPAVARLRPRRNPVVYLAGASGAGKTTLSQFATGCYGAPTRAPLRMEGGRSTPAGIYQTVEQLGGLPLFIDEAHTAPDLKKIEQAVYAFANGQRYTVGGVDQKARGGSDLFGTLLLSGEAMPDFKHAGAALRVLWIDASTWYPLGTPPRSEEGQQRAAVLEAAWEDGAGLFGLQVTERIWEAWPQFVAAVKALEADPALAPLGAWRTPLALAAAALGTALPLAGIQQVPEAWSGELLDRWAEMLTSGHSDADPAEEAWEALITLLAQGHRRDDSDTESVSHQPIPNSAAWEWIEADRGGGMIAARRVGESYLRVIANTPQFKERVGTAAVQLYGPTWIKRGWVLPAKDGKATDVMKMRDMGAMRVLKIPLEQLDGWSP